MAPAAFCAPPGAAAARASVPSHRNALKCRLLGVRVAAAPRRVPAPLAVATAAAAAAAAAARPQTSFSHILVAILDSNPQLSTSSRSALASAAALTPLDSRLSVLFVDEAPAEGAPAAADGRGRARLVSEELARLGLVDVKCLEETVEAGGGRGAVAVGEAADSIGADLVVVASAAVHDKHVDANLLAEMVDAPVLLLP